MPQHREERQMSRIEETFRPLGWRQRALGNARRLARARRPHQLALGDVEVQLGHCGQAVRVDLVHLFQGDRRHQFAASRSARASRDTDGEVRTSSLYKRSGGSCRRPDDELTRHEPRTVGAATVDRSEKDLCGHLPNLGEYREAGKDPPELHGSPFIRWAQLLVARRSGYRALAP